MKDWRDKRMIDYLEGLNAELPQSDWDDFLSRKAVHDVAAKRRRGFLTAAISISAAAAVLLLLFLLPVDKTPAGQMAQNNPEPQQEALPATIDSIPSPIDSVMLGGILAEPELIENKVAMTPSITTVRISNDTVSFNHETHRQRVDSMLARNNVTKEEPDSITADMMERVAAYEQTKEPSNTNMTYGSLGMISGATGDMPLSESNLNFGGFGGFGGFGSLGGSADYNVTGVDYKTLNPNGDDSVSIYPLILLDGEIISVDEAKLSAFDFGAPILDRYKLADLVGIRGDKIQAVQRLDNREAEKKWGDKGAGSSLEILTRKYYRKARKAGKLSGHYQWVTDLNNCNTFATPNP